MLLLVMAYSPLVLLTLAAMALGFWYGMRLDFDVWAVAITVALWGLLAPLIFWSARGRQ